MLGPSMTSPRAQIIRNKYDAEPGFIAQNLPMLVDFLEKVGVENPLVCAGINKIGYLMNPSQRKGQPAHCVIFCFPRAPVRKGQPAHCVIFCFPRAPV